MPSGNPGATTEELIQLLLDAATGSMEVLKAIRKNDVITDFEIVMANYSAKGIYGNDVVGKRFMTRLGGSRRQFDLMVQVNETGRSYQIEVKQEKETKWFLENYTKYNDGVIVAREDITVRKVFKRDNSNSALSIIGISTDIEEDKILNHSEEKFKVLSEDLENRMEDRMLDLQKAKQRLKEESHLTNQILDTSPDIIYIMDLNTRQVTFTNRIVAAYLGYTRQQIMQMANPVFDIMHPEDIPRMMEHLDKVKTISLDDEVVEIEYRLKKAKGGYCWFIDRNSVFNRNPDNIPLEKIGICRDISKEKEREGKNLTSIKLLKQSEEIVDIGSWEYCVESEEFKWSEGMYNLFRIPFGEEVTPYIYLDYCIDIDEPVARKIINHIISADSDFEETLTIMVSGDDKKVLRIKGVLQKDKKSKPVKVVGVDLDISEKVKLDGDVKNLYDILIRKNEELQNMNEEIRNFNIVTAHDYKETLQQLYTNLEYIVSKDAKNLSESGRANIRRAQSSIQRMNLLTDDINSYFGLFDRDFSFGPTDLNVVMKKVVEKYTPRLDQVSGNMELTPFPVVQSHPALFAQLMGNLIDNSIKFRKAVLPLQINIRYSLADELNGIEKAIKNIPYCIISVSDNGIGFREEEADKIFTLFYRSDKNSTMRGSGIGLSICKKIMQFHSGFITAESALAHGATFNCYFPMNSKFIAEDNQ